MGANFQTTSLTSWLGIRSSPEAFKEFTSLQQYVPCPRFWATAPPNLCSPGPSQVMDATSFWVKTLLNSVRRIATLPWADATSALSAWGRGCLTSSTFLNTLSLCSWEAVIWPGSMVFLALLYKWYFCMVQIQSSCCLRAVVGDAIWRSWLLYVVTSIPSVTIFSIVSRLNASQYDNTLFSFTLFSCLE